MTEIDSLYKMSFKDDQKQPVPENLRVSLDPNDADAHTRLLEADAIQQQWKSKDQTEIPAPRDRQRQNAQIMVDALLLVADRTDDQDEILAESFAALGQYDLADAVSKDPEKKALYKKYWDAVWRDDGEWCEHVDEHKYIKDNIWSVREGKELPLLACNVAGCDDFNVLDAPDNLIEAQKTRANIRQQTKDMTQDEVKAHLTKSGLRR